jgi:flagellin-like hook-associated protein FlgL
MKTLSIALSQALYNYGLTTKNINTVSSQVSSGKKVSSSKDDPILWNKANKNSYAYNNIQIYNESLNSVATNIQVANSVMDSIEQVLGQMKAILEGIVKNYPPYPQGSEERAKLLATFNSLRQQIDQLTVPTNYNGAAKIMANTSTFPEAGDWDVLLDGSGNKMTIHSQQVNTGVEGLNISEISTDASDEKINDMIDTMKTAINTLGTKRNSLNLEAVSINRAKEYNTTVGQLYQKYSEQIQNADTTEKSAELQSLALQNSLSINAINSLLSVQSKILDLWR